MTQLSRDNLIREMGDRIALKRATVREMRADRKGKSVWKIYMDLYVYI